MEGSERKRRQEKGRGREERRQEIIGEVRKEKRGQEKREETKTKYRSFIYWHAIVSRGCQNIYCSSDSCAKAVLKAEILRLKLSERRNLKLILTLLFSFQLLNNSSHEKVYSELLHVKRFILSCYRLFLEFSSSQLLHLTLTCFNLIVTSLFLLDICLSLSVPARSPLTSFPEHCSFIMKSSLGSE